MNSELVYLVQTDTTVGFASQNSDKLAVVKNRSKEKKFLRTYSSLKLLQSETRVQKSARKIIRRAKNTTFVYKDGYARRVVFNTGYYDFLKRFEWMYSTSANPSGENFSKEWAKNQCDAIVYSDEKFEVKNASSIFKISKIKMKKLR